MVLIQNCPYDVNQFVNLKHKIAFNVKVLEDFCQSVVIQESSTEMFGNESSGKS